MSRQSRPNVSWRYLAVTASSFALLAGLLASGPAVAHTFTRNDGNDSASKIDLRSVWVSHTATGVVHGLRTYNAWTPQSLQHDSLFVIGIDKNNDPSRYERCAFIYYTSRLRGLLSNCGSQFISYLRVAKLSGTTAKITIPKSQTGQVYHWYVESYWVGAVPCRRACRDFAPNVLPDILHEMIPPVVVLDILEDIRAWEASTSTTFDFPFTVSDAHSGIKSWTLQSGSPGSSTWSNVVSGTGAGPFAPDVNGVEGTQDLYRAQAVDNQGNVGLSLTRQVLVPLDDDNLGTAGTFSDPAVQPDPTSFAGSYQVSDLGERLTYNATTGGLCREFAVIGPGGGAWTVDVYRNGILAVQVSAPGAGPRQVLYSDTLCFDTDFEFVVSSGSGFGVDAVLI